ncbi:MAG: FAD-binding oxidoreductase [Gammaproteobacteria bacterium]|nr:FAD-binding oxidoreductase [Gammaproteobacteria bacterium]
MREIDTLILGQGLAGSLLAERLLRQEIDLLVLDDGWQSAASTAAAGLINPITGQRLVKTADLEVLLPAALAHYRQLQQRFGQPLHHPRPMLRLLRQPQQQAQLEMRRQDPAYSPWLGPLLAARDIPASIKAPHGAFEQFHAGFVDLPLLLQGIRQELLERGRLRQGRIDFEQIRLTPSGVEIGDLRARRLIFCEGYRVSANPWFKALPFQPAKGEILSLELPNCGLEQIISGSHWLIPLQGNRYRLGSNYDHAHLDQTPSEAIKQALLAGLSDLLHRPGPVQLLQHLAGVRPALRGAQPVMGPHPRYAQLHLFNGFGSKGSLLVPWHAQAYADYLSGKGQIPPNADIRRFHDLLLTH